jgi:3-oxoacyl-[acyl-carrier-protein] synthase II
LALKEGRIPPTLNLESADESLDENLLKIVSGKVLTESEKTSIVKRLVLKNSFGFGGTNVSLLLSEFRN